MRIVSARLRNFRCFSSLDLDLERPIVLLHGPNGSGKTSILEALHYACYLKSFKTHLPKELVRSGADGFAVGLSIATQGFDSLSVQFAHKKKTIKLNEQGIGSYKELYDAYRVVTINEADLEIIQGSPGARRSFLDMVVQFMDPSHAALTKKYRTILDNRNALLVQAKLRGSLDQESYELWTEQLLQASHQIQRARSKAITVLKHEGRDLIKEILGDHAEEPLNMSYSYALPHSALENSTPGELAQKYPSLKNNEIRQRRTLFGAHLDDCNITYLGKDCRTYSSRGQQKLVLFMLKLAQLKVIQSLSPAQGAILLVDDFMTDFDEERMQALIPLMTKLSSQVILTSPVADLLYAKLPPEDTQSINVESLTEDTSFFKIQDVTR